MASLGHIAVGMAAARTLSPRQRPSWTSMAVWSGLSMLPDADVIGLPLGIAYEAPWGHRGATHSLVFALAAAGVAALVAPRLGLLRGRTFAVAAVVLASHPLLDTLTDGGLGCALLWPFDLTRYFAPWRPMPVSPIGLAFFSPYGAFVAATELILFSPLLRFALFTGVPRGGHAFRRAAFWAGWLVLVWLVVSTDPVRQRVLGLVFRESTEYAAGYSEAAFDSIRDGTARADVERLLGTPLEQEWYYTAFNSDECRIVHFADGAVTRWLNFDRCTPPGIRLGMSIPEVRAMIGSPIDECWAYSRSGNGSFFQGRGLCFAEGRVLDINRRWVPDRGQAVI